MKAKVYMRIGLNPNRTPGYKVEASHEPVDKPLVVGGRSIPTARFALELDLPDSQFRLAEQVLAEIKVAESTKFIVGDVHMIEV
jgi:hypothetical protein